MESFTLVREELTIIQSGIKPQPSIVPRGGVKTSVKDELQPGPPVNVRFSTKRTSSLIKLRWDPPEKNPDAVQRYELQMKRRSKHDWDHVMYSHKLSAKATGLKSNTNYYFRVRSCNRAGKGEFSEEVKKKTRLGKAAVAFLTPGVFLGGTIAAPFVGVVGGGAVGGALGGVSGIAVAEKIDNKAGAAAAGITTGVTAGVAGGVAGAVGGGVVGTLGAPVVGGVLARKFVKHGDDYSSQSSEEEFEEEGEVGSDGSDD